ncbi:MAG: prepilin-type N-terminal cleavage/methylation domain-containing protein [Pseudanabaenaceae cyanobacterium bins.39]|nr:prepilin-type N-terminal cleavage/methylation domain-containing protein [Pseudanabaenaceae cyanobacterium bins.39]
MKNNPIYRMAIATASTDSESGFSLIESLVAAAVVSILIVAIAPMVAVSTSARINARRIDQATQAARSYIDAVRGGVIDVSGFPSSLIRNNQNAQKTYIFEDPVTPANSVAAPTSALLALDSPTATTPVRGIKVDVDGNGFSVNDPQDLVIQPMRSGSNNATELSRQGFWLAVRVYRADALATGVTARIGSDTQCAQGKTAFSTTASVVCPLVTMRSQIMPTVNANNLDDIKLGIGN